MDPNEALRLLRKYASDTGGEFGEQFEALDEWLSKGGFLPAAWCHPRPRAELDEIHNLLSGNPWTPDTLDSVAGVLNRAGYEVLEPDAPIGPFTVMLCEECDTDREVDTYSAEGVATFRVCGHVETFKN